MENHQAEDQIAGNRLTRRDFVKIGATAAAIGATAIALKPTVGTPAEAALSEQVTRPDESIIKTTCALCPSGCGLDIRVVNGKAVKVEGNPLHPVNQGVCCLRAQTSLEILYSPERLAHPRIQTGQRGSGDWKEVSWDEALALVAQKLGELRENGQAHTLAFVHGETRGQMRSLIHRFMQAYGSPNVIGRESLAEQAARQAMFLTQGINSLPVYDLNHASYVMCICGNL
jgi:thiosulfate reductase/polysulfide reductase chain A